MYTVSVLAVQYQYKYWYFLETTIRLTVFLSFLTLSFLKQQLLEGENSLRNFLC